MTTSGIILSGPINCKFDALQRLIPVIRLSPNGWTALGNGARVICAGDGQRWASACICFVRPAERNNQTLQWTGAASSVLVNSKPVGAVPVLPVSS